MRCGKKLADSTQELCSDCVRIRHSFTRGAAVCSYRDVSSILYRFKYGGRREYAEWLGSRMAERVMREEDFAACSLIVPVPLSKERMISRGYNQAELLGNVVSRKTGIPINSDLLIRSKRTLAMKEMDHAQRRENMKKAFIVNGNDVKCKIIMLIDDIYTTGATMDACSEALLAAGAAAVYFVVFATGESGPC
ncbi:MAG: ComF family protein [Lachnospiraceae bacterium]|nr:ComF family protein [Lachnospiraceae bacterium]